MSLQNLDALLRSRNALVIGDPATPLERGLLARATASARSIASLPSTGSLLQYAQQPLPDALALVFDGRRLEARGIEALAASGCRGLIWTGSEAIPDELLRAARPHRLRFLGPRSAGFFCGGGIAAGAFPADISDGRIALIAQSGSIAAAAVDWASGRGIGFSWAVTTGAEADADIADFLDLAALDPKTRAVIVQIGRIGAGRKFMSAARACARLKPVVVLQSRVGGREALSGPDPVRSAAFARAGLVECSTLDGLFDALAALANVPARSHARVLTLGVGAGVCALGVDAVLRHQLELGACSDAAFASLQALAPRARRLDGAIDLGAVEPEALASICRRLLVADEPFDYLLLVHSPAMDAGHESYVDALLSARLEPRLLTVWLGLKTAMLARQRSSAAGLPTFLTAGQAARALRYRWLHGRTRELLMQTPPPLPSVPDAPAARRIVEAATQAQSTQLSAPQGLDLLRHYGLGADRPARIVDGLHFELELRSHSELGLHLAITAVSGLLQSPTALGFVPMDPLLAMRMLESLGLALDAAQQQSLGDALCAVSQLVLDLPRVARLGIRLGLDAGSARIAPESATVQLAEPSPERQRLVLAPYPAALEHALRDRKGRGYHLRAIRPEDEPALLGLLERLRPEDVRLRFFSTIRYFSHEMAARISQVDYDRELVLVVSADDEPKALCALAHLIVDADGEAGEFALLVHHDQAGAGLGHALMLELLAHGRRRGLRHIHGDVLRQNSGMLGLAHALGFVSEAHPDDVEVRRVRLDLQAA